MIAEDMTKPMLFSTKVKSGYTDIIVKIKPTEMILSGGKLTTRPSISEKRFL
jgi:hypothetical protein